MFESPANIIVVLCVCEEICMNLVIISADYSYDNQIHIMIKI